jgi:hypothetical protein
MDRMPVCGTCDPGSIPGESTNGHPICASIWGVAVCSSHSKAWEALRQESKRLSISHGLKGVRYETCTVPVGEDYPGESIGWQGLSRGLNVSYTE